MADVKPKPAKIERLENDYTRRLDHQQARAHRHQWLGKRRMRRATRILAVFAVFALVLSIQLVRTNASLHHVQQEVTTSKQKLTATKATNRKLQLQIKQLNDKDYLGRLIRSKYYYSKSGETIYSLPGDHASDVTVK
ncbi:FtsB family cell division protein [Levilactobacillus tujiorum]|uniref:Septum formation initiator family protein n=1 Tax=Levilactobacillus tujiorum TaxID=2912243 RepID=A0ABX1L681_9LACO|nr:septum formation initiator family protein [Levilactobacillus tujiorum]MCH5465561.1 septum formation initiator family protein [Levilactobacillus tujiorum]NLR12699.1 septum formation initiator family protein [Lactobacillus sp. HBUAS51387]NLR30552.1 septum formation initiator family protein [Levilactobacillus tujiorum]NLR31832.1 septum formation initiator family protein [Levilactobacillus tujiorum]